MQLFKLWTDHNRLITLGTLLAGVAIGCVTFPPLLHWSLGKSVFYGVGVGVLLLMVRALTAAYLFFRVRGHK
jgi:hypothetical protein